MKLLLNPWKLRAPDQMKLLLNPWKLRTLGGEEDFIREEYLQSSRYPRVIAQIEKSDKLWYWSFVYMRDNGYSDTFETACNNADSILRAKGWKLLNERHIIFT